MHDDVLHRALSHDEQWARYHRLMQTYEVLQRQWEENGKLGPRPPRPVRPHVPGFQVPDVPG